MKTPLSSLIATALSDSLKKLNPITQFRNIVMFCVYLGAIACTFITLYSFKGFYLQLTIWLWFTVLFANFAESLAEGRGKAQADSLRQTRKDTVATRLVDGKEETVLANALRKGDVVVCRAGDVIPGDGDVIEGISSVDESAITGESAPVIRESGGDRSAVTGGTRVISDCITIKITSNAGESFLDRMIQLVENAERKPTPNELALGVVLTSLTVLFFLAVLSLKAFMHYSETASGLTSSIATVPVLIALFVCLAPTTIGALLSAIGISGIDRLIRKNVLAMTGKAVEAAGDIDVLLLDKTGTITLGNRTASAFLPISGVSEKELSIVAQLSSLSDETPEGRSIVVFAKEKYNLRSETVQANNSTFVPFSAQTRMSGVDIQDESGLRCIRKGSLDAVKAWLESKGQTVTDEISTLSNSVAQQGATPLVVCENTKVLGVIVLKDQVKGGIKERFSQLRMMGIRTVMITGDNPLTAASIAAEAGVDDFIATATPEAKLKRIREEQQKGFMVAMIGDGTNDAPALAQADVGVAMNTGTQAAREAGNMVDLDSNPTKLIEIVEVGKQLLMTRGALTTFSIANDVAKYFAILPALFSSIYVVNGYGPLSALNIMHLYSPESAILSSIIFNALIIVCLIPLALKGVAYRPLGAASVLQRNLLIYGVGGVITPFIGIKAIDVLLVFLHLV